MAATSMRLLVDRWCFSAAPDRRVLLPCWFDEPVGAVTVGATDLPLRAFNIHVPLKNRGGAGHFPVTEDKALSAYLFAELEELQSTSTVPPVCPRCDSRETGLIMHVRGDRAPFPAFHCKTCRKWLNRLTGTPLFRLCRRDAIPGFVRFLSQQLPYAAAAEALDLDERVVASWVAKFRVWLLKLDPSGHWEARVRLGLRPPEPVLKCPFCRHSGEAMFYGFGRRQAGPRHVRQFRCQACRGVFAVRREGLEQIAIPAEQVRADYSCRTRATVISAEPRFSKCRSASLETAAVIPPSRSPSASSTTRKRKLR